MNHFDQCARYATKLDPAGFFRWLLPGLEPHFAFHSWLDTRTLPFPGEADRTCDTVARFESAQEPQHPAALVVEFQSQPDPDMLDRLFEYLARLRRELRHGPQRQGKYPVVAALLNLTGPAQPDALDMRLAGAELHLQVVLKTLREEDAGRTVQEIVAGRLARGILPWVPLMHGGGESDIINQWKAVAAAEPDSRLRAAYGSLALIFADLVGRLAEWRQALEGWNMTESQVVLEWLRAGEVAAKRADVLRLLQLRFAIPVPADITEQVKAASDLNQLSHWFDTAAQAPSLDAFRAAMKNGQ
jgi:hypothetical protein